jgi:hypothetical protein
MFRGHVLLPSSVRNIGTHLSDYTVSHLDYSNIRSHRIDNSRHHIAVRKIEVFTAVTVKNAVF